MALLIFSASLTSPPLWAQAAQPATADPEADAVDPRVVDRLALVVNGIGVDGATTTLVPGTTYAPAEGFAGALGAHYRFDPNALLLSLEFGSHLLLLRGFPVPEGAVAARGALSLDGSALPGPGALMHEGRLYLPVKSVAAALGGRTAFLAEQGVVTVVFPRPQLTQVSPPSVWGNAERFVLIFSAPVVWDDLSEPSSSLGVVRFRFFRASLSETGAATGEATRRFSGGRFSDAAFVADVGYLDFNVTLRKGNRYSIFSEPYGRGERVVIDLFAAGGQTGGLLTGLRAGEIDAPQVVIDPAEGTLALARELKRMLEQRGVSAQLTWDETVPDLALRMRAGIGAPLFVSLSRAPLGPERFNLYYLSEEGVNGGGTSEAPTPEVLAADIRSVSAEQLGAMGQTARARLAPFSPDFTLGAALAQSLRAGLEQRAGLRLDELIGAPLYVLGGAAGRGVMLELSTEVPASPELVAALADTLVGSLEASVSTDTVTGAP